MEFKIEKDKLVKGLGWVQSVVEKRSTMPILSNALFRAGKSELKIIATDLEVGIEGTVEADVKKKGAITLNAKKMFDIIKELPPGPVQVSVEENLKAEIKGAKAVFHLMGTNEEEFPPLPEYSKDKLVEIPAGTFKEMIEKTIFAASMEETRYNLGGVFVTPSDSEKTLRMVATDGHRLSMIDREIPGLSKLELKKGVVLPRKGLNELKKILVEGVEKLGVCIISNNIVFDAGEVVLIMRMMEGEYPDYKRVIPKDNEIKVLVNREQMVESIKRVSVISEEKTRSIKLHFKKNKLLIDSQNPEMGDANEEVDVEGIDETIEIGYNSRYLMDVFSAMEGEKVTMSFKDNLSSALFQSEEDSKYVCIVMPMRL